MLGMNEQNMYTKPSKASTLDTALGVGCFAVSKQTPADLLRTMCWITLLLDVEADDYLEDSIHNWLLALAFLVSCHITCAIAGCACASKNRSCTTHCIVPKTELRSLVLVVIQILLIEPQDFSKQHTVSVELSFVVSSPMASKYTSFLKS